MTLPISFEKYLANAEYNKKKKYSANTIKLYTQGAPTYLMNNYRFDMLKERSPEVVESRLNKLLENPKFVDDNLRVKKAYSCAMERYCEFLIWRNQI